ncbi:MAG TPA: hypothetical protein VE422_30725 [Terriglobia bacterium]|nr:hypothetical protein [Terriglobia bacterium]
MTFDDFQSLGRYFLWSDQLKEEFEEALRDEPHDDAPKTREWFGGRTAVFLSHWLASLYVVVEGYRSQQLYDESVEDLLKSPHADLLRRYRNGVFHFQADYWDDRFIDWFDVPTVDWSTALHRALHEFILALGIALRGTSPDRDEKLMKFMRAGQR